MSLPGIDTTSNIVIARLPLKIFPVAVAVLMVTLPLLQPEWVQAAVDWVGSTAITQADPLLLATHLYEIQSDVVELEAFSYWGGAIEPLGDNLLVATPRGRIALIDNEGKVEYLPQRVPMNESASEAPILWTGFRVADILLHERQPDSFTLYVSHHYFAGDCVDLRISSTTLRTNDTGAAFSSDWKTEFIANPCIDREIFDFDGRGEFRPADAC